MKILQLSPPPINVLAEIERQTAAVIREMGIPASMCAPIVDSPTARDIYEVERRPYRLLNTEARNAPPSEE